MLKIAVIDGQGGGIGSLVVKGLRESFHGLYSHQGPDPCPSRIFGKDILRMFSKRKQKRETVSKECRVVCHSGGWSSNGVVVNISEGGAGVELEQLPTTKDEVILYMTDKKGGKEIIKKARVAWFINKTQSPSAWSRALLFPPANPRFSGK